ncbi:MAG: SDR family NAD(P)-dependent oxidoreductase [Elusimicrobia bacterium]|nr:SDR family NAD(P)-dependent oxidoreductase [Elusimicrobiota bacterium]
MSHTALVTGGNRGIGLEACRQFKELGLKVVLTARDATEGRRAAEGLGCLFEPLDVSSDSSVAACAASLKKAKTQVDILVNNAGIYPDGGVLSAAWDDLRAGMEANYWGALRTCRAFVPGMLERGYGRIVNVTSGYGLFSEGLEGPAPYSLSKAALDALTLKLSKEVAGDVKVNAVCPGWVRTRMGGRAAPRPVEKGAETIVWLATLPMDGPSGGVFRDKRPLEW